MKQQWTGFFHNVLLAVFVGCMAWEFLYGAPRWIEPECGSDRPVLIQGILR